MTKRTLTRPAAVQAQAKAVTRIIDRLTELKEPFETDSGGTGFLVAPPIWLALDEANIHLRNAQKAIRRAAEEAQLQRDLRGQDLARWAVKGGGPK